MKKRLYVGILVLAGIISITSSAHAGKAGSVILTTMDLKEPYEVMSIITHRNSSSNLDDLIKGIKAAANTMGADAVIGVRFIHGDYYYAYGTAVKFEGKK